MWYFALLFLLAVGRGDDLVEDIQEQTFPCDAGKTVVVNDTGRLTADDIDGKCIWNIATNGNIFLVFERFVIGGADNLTISGNAGVQKFSGNKAPFSVFIVGNANVTLELKRKKNMPKIFRAYVNVHECHYDMPSDVRALASPIYPAGKPQCTFNITSIDSVHSLSLVFDKYHLNNSTLQITGSDIPHEGNYTGTDRPSDVFANETLILVLSLVENSKNDSFTISLYDIIKDCSSHIVLDDDHPTVQLKGLPAIQESVERGAECRWLIESNKDTAIGFTFKSVELMDSLDQLIFNDGPSMHSKALFIVNSINDNFTTDQYIRSSRNSIWVSFKPVKRESNFKGNATMYKNGRLFKSKEGKFSLPKANTDQHVVFLIEVPNPKEQVILTVDNKNSSLTTGSVLSVYSEFSTNAPLIANLTVNKMYPVVSPRNKMMVIAQNFTNSTLSASFKSIHQGCYEMSSKSSDTYSLSDNCNKNCSWIINPTASSNEVFALYITKTEGIEQNIHIKHLDPGMTNVAWFPSNLTNIPELYVPAEFGASVTVERTGNCSQQNETYFFASYVTKPNCHASEKLQKPQLYELSSPNYPNTYPLFADCWWNLTSSSSAYALLTFSKLQLAPGHSIKVFNLKNGSTSLLATFTGQQLPPDLFTGLNVSLQFEAFNHTQKQTQAFTDQGYKLNITAADCGGMYNSTSGCNLTTGVNKTMCVWVVQVPPVSKDSVNIIIYKVQQENNGDNTDLKVFDGSSLRDSLILNSTKGEIWSRTNALIFVYSNITKSKFPMNITYRMQACNKSMQCANGICLHPDWRCNGLNDCGDFSDEMNCTNPDHHGSDTKGNTAGVSPVAVGVVIPLIFIAGILCAIGVPYLLRRYRGGRYQQFRDASITD